MSNQVVTIGYLRNFVKNKLTVSTSQSDSYCPTYSELTGNVLVPNYSSASNPKDTVNGIRINGCSVGGSYASNQLVVQADLQLLYMVLDKISIEADTTSVDACFDGSINICATGSFHLETKSEGGGISKGGTETDSTILVNWSGNADSSGPSNCTTISFDENKIGGNDNITTNPSSQPSRSESTSASYLYEGKNLTSNNYTTKTSNTVTITQGANTLGSWYTNTSLDRNVTISVSCPGSVSEYGGSATVTSTVTYEYCEERKDQCGHIVGRKWTSKTITGPSQTVTFSERECEEPATSKTVNLTYTHVNGLTASDSCVVWQDASTVSCYCGENCKDVGCSGRIHWLCTEKKVYENVDGTYTISGLKDGKLSCEGGTATVRISSSTDREYWTKSAYCSIETLGTVMGNSTSQDNVGLVYSHTGTTGTLYYYNSNLNYTSTYAAKYTAYTRNHITLHNNLDGTSSYITETIPGYSYKYEANSVNDWYRYSRKYYSRSSYVSAGGDGDDWDSAMDRYYETYWEDGYYKCSVTGEEVSSPSSKCETTDESGNTVTGTITWIMTDSGYDDDYDPRETGMTLWHTSYNVITGQKPADVDMDKVAGACCVRNISTEHDYFWSAKTTPNSIIETFEYPQNKGIEDLKGSTVLSFKNTSPKPGQINSITVEYTVAACTTNTDKYTLVSVSGPTSMVACSAIPGNGVDIVVNGTHSIIKVSNIDHTISGETTPSAYTMVKDTDYKLEYTPTGSNTGDKERDVTVTITGLGKFSGQTKTFTYKQKADKSCFTGTTCDPSTSYTYSNYVITYNGGAVNCDKTATPTVKADKTTTVTDVFCNESATTENSVTITDFTVSYSPNGNNNSTSNRVVTGTVTHNGKTAGTFTYTQNSGQTCYATTDVTGTTSELSVVNTTIEKCATSATVVVKGRTGVTHTTGNTVWGSETTLTEGTHYTLSINPEIKANETESPVTYTVTVNGIGTYANKSAQGTITQSAGPCTTCEPSTSYTYSNYVVTYNGGAVNCDKTATPTVKADKTTTIIDSYCKESTTTDSSVTITDFTVSYNPNGNNNTTSNRVVTGTVTHNGKIAGTFTYTQNSGQTCYSSTDVTGTTYEITAETVSIDACATSATVVVKGRTGMTHTTSTTVTNHSNWSILTKGTDYDIEMPTIEKNMTESEVTYTASITGKGLYNGKNTTAIIKQEAGICCSTISVIAKVEENMIYWDFNTNLTMDCDLIITLTDGINTTSEEYYCPSGQLSGGGQFANLANYNNFENVVLKPYGGAIVDLLCSNGWSGQFVYPDCTCTVTNISVEPSEHIFTSEDDYEFTVNIIDNDCDCTDQFTVYNSKGEKVIGGANTFSLPNATDTYTVISDDNTNVKCTVKTTKYNPTCDTKYDYANANLTFKASIGKCDTKPTITDVIIENVSFTSSTCSTSVINEPVPDVGYNITSTHSQNTGNSRNVTVSIKTGELYGSLSKSITITQEGGCVIYTGSTTEYKLQVLNATVDKCATTAPTITVQGASRTVSGYSNGSTKESEWSSWSNLTKDTHYTLSVPTISQNTGTTSKSYEVTATGKGTYAGKTAKGTITQEGGCVSYTGSTTEYKLQVLNANMAKCDTTVSPTVQGASRTVSGYSDGSTKESDWSSWSNLTKDTHYTLSYNPSLGENNTSSVKTYEVTATGKGTYARKTAKGTITQAAGPCKCTAFTTWDSISVTDVTAGKCSTSASMTVTASGTKTNTDCTTATTSTTLSSSNYTVKYGKTNGSYTLDSIEANETTSEVTWYYKVTASSTYGSKTATGSFKQEKGKCTPDPVYVMQKTSGDTSTSITFPGDVTYDGVNSYGYICCYSTKDGANQSVTTSSDSDWLTVESNNSLPYQGSNYNFKFTCTKNNNTSRRTGKITITQSGSNKTVTWTITQSGKPQSTVYIYTFKNCYSDRQLGLFASNASPSGSHTKYAMLSALDGQSVIEKVDSIDGMPVNNSSNSTGTSAKIGDSIKVYSVQGQSWKLEETITLTAANRSFEYGCIQCNCSNMSISLSKYSDVLVNNDAYTTVTVKSSDGTCPTTWTASNGTTGTTGGLFRVSAIGNYVITPTSCTDKSATFNVKEASIVKSITITNNFSETIYYAGGEGSSENKWNGTLAGGNSYTFNVTNQDSRHIINLRNCGYANSQSWGSGGISISINGDNIEFSTIIQDGSVAVGSKTDSSVTLIPTMSGQDQFNGMIDIVHGRYLFEISFS